MRLHRLVTGGAIVAVLAGTAACGLQTVEPQLELRDAAKAFGASSAGALRLSIGSSVADLRAFDKEASKENPPDTTTSDSSTSDGTTSDSATGDQTSVTTTHSALGGDLSGMSDSDIKTITSSHIDFAFDRGADAKKTEDDSALVVVHVGDTDAVEIRSVAQMLYARVDFAGLEKQFPQMKDGVEGMRAQFTGEGAAAADAPPEALRAPATALFDSRWISLDDRKGSWLEKQLQGTQDGSGGGLSPDAPAKLKQLAGKAFANNVLTVKRAGTDNLGDHLVASANLRKMYEQIRGDVPGLFTGQTGDDLVKSLPAVDSVPNRTIAVSFWVKDGKLSRAELDFAQFLDKPAGHLVLRADALPNGKIVAPAGAVALDPQAIAQQSGMSLDELLTGPKMDAKTVATYVDQDVVSMADEDGALPSVRYLPRVRQDMADLADQSGVTITLTQVGKRIQVTVDGKSACLTLAKQSGADGTVTDGPC